MLTPSSSSNRDVSTISTETWSSWYFTDNGIGTSIDNDTSTEYSNPENFEKQICDLQALRQKLLEEEKKKETFLKQVNAEGKFDQARLEAEKNILLATLKTSLLLAEFKHKYESQRERDYFNIGSVTISDIKLHCDKTQYLKKFKHYFLCALTTGSKLFLSQIVQADSKDVINFNINHTFLNLPVDFEIGVRIYILRHRKKTITDKLLGWFKRGVPEENSYRRNSLFKLWKEASIKISNVNETNEIILDLFDSKLCKLVYDVTAKVDTSSFLYSGWLDVSQNGLFWNQRWCVLQGTLLKCFNYPVDHSFNNPLTTIDLKYCVTIRDPFMYEASRNRVLVLEMNDDSHPFAYYLSTYSVHEFNQWKCLEKLVATLQLWAKYNCKII
ncbi:anillin [Tribolium castaneum]|uniref:Actin-binding protein anillin-like Protein n=1 Tax=Tribolium castaneum TaxID=7070 RepID=A0A139WMH2_TRICA|nr:PREDICTED: actin-binding protein anillin [Tribolium castaneum]KYB29122.1 Actin-binding protein anillin-like Protein [Tribolium castaneum]|eukprot:XP_008201401.1 PREDICTED: actin-binding protein anillin [Tribolium castaneum]